VYWNISQSVHAPVGRIGTGGGVVGDPQRVIDELGRIDVVLPEVLARVDDGAFAELLLHVVEPQVHARRDARGVDASIRLHVEHGRQVHRPEGAHRVHEDVGLRDGVLVGRVILVDAAYEALRRDALPVRVEPLVDVRRAVGHARDGEVDARARRRVPVDLALPLGDVDAGHRGPVGAHRVGLRDAADSPLFVRRQPGSV
jgi:hypothetical protein